MIPKLEDIKIAIVGLGYVGLPLAVEFGKSKFAPVIGLNKSQRRIDALRTGHDPNKEVLDEELQKAQIEYTIDPARLKEANFIIVTVPTPINQAKQPDLTLVRESCKTIGENLSPGTVIVYESTVYPGVTEEICASIIEKASGLKCGEDFKVGYSPERVNPGDFDHTIGKIIKIVSGMDEETLELVAQVYGEVCKGGVHKVVNIKTAEAAKVIENVQRDLNIALVNELSLIFHRLGINTKDVIEAAGTKWNFHKYQPGLVGGHCIGVDPYYLTHRAQELGYNPQVILAGRRINDYMPEYVAELMLQGLVEAGKVVRDARILILGLTFKENIRDMRNSKIQDTILKLKTYGMELFGHDPNLRKEEVETFGVKYIEDITNMEKVDGVILAVSHKEFVNLKLEDFVKLYNSTGDNKGVLVDIKSKYVHEDNKNLIYRCL